jgi:siderophore synthetase component
MVNFREIEEGEPLLFRDRRNNEVYTEYVTFAGFAETGHPVVEFENGRRLIVLPDQLAYPQVEEFVNIRIYRADRDRLAATMKYGDTMADKIHTLIEEARDESDSSDALPK